MSVYNQKQTYSNLLFGININPDLSTKKIYNSTITNLYCGLFLTFILQPPVLDLVNPLVDCGWHLVLI